MPVSVIEDTVRGASWSLKGGRVRSFVVTGIAQGSGNKAMLLASKAVDATTGRRVPQQGTQHPTEPEFRVDDIAVEPFLNARDKFRVNVIYKSDEAGAGGGGGGKTDQQILEGGGTLIRMSSGTTTQVTQYDRDGSVMTVVYKVGAKPKDKLEPEAKNPDSFWQVRESQILAPTLQIEYVRLENKSPMVKNKKYRRTLNSNTWNGEAPETWMCLGISGSYNTLSKDLKHEVHYLFEHRDLPPRGQGWRSLQLFHHKDTGEVPGDINPKAGGWPRSDWGNGWREFQHYSSENFDMLFLPDYSKL